MRSDKEGKMDAYKLMCQKIDNMSDEELLSVWNALEGHVSPNEFYCPEITMEEWAEHIYIELNKRKIPFTY
jgi:hypothetical protein